MRIGIGYDLHQLVKGRPLILGGVLIPFEKGLLGHSDGDALAHAITDALLGAAAMGNIGRLFPDTNPQFKDARSMDLLGRAMHLLREQRYEVANIDANVIAERPKLNPYLDVMSETIAGCLAIDVRRVSIKAKTNEHVGAEGREEAISVQAVVLIDGPGDSSR